MRIHHLPGLLALPLALACLPLTVACGDKDGDDTGSVPEADADTDADSDTDTDTDTDSDTDSDTDIDVASLAIELSASELSSRDSASWTATVTYTDDSTEDVSTSEDLGASTSDPAVFDIFVEPWIRPLGNGTATLTLTYEGVSAEADVTVTVDAAGEGDLLIYELLTDGLAEGDPNGDGTVDSVEDEFIEIVNTAEVTVDLSGVTIVENELSFQPRHTFAPDTMLRAGEAIVVFGGGDVSSLSADNATFVTVDNNDSGTYYGLDLGNNGDRVSVVSASGTTISSVAYGDHVLADQDAVKDASMACSSEYPFACGSYEDHGSLGSLPYSPGTFPDGSAFPGVYVYEAE